MSARPPTDKEYSVTLVAWNTWQIWLNAKSAKEAEDEAVRVLCEEGEEDFKLRDCGIDYVEAWEVVL